MPPTLVLLPGMHGTPKLFGRFVKAIPNDWPTRVLSYPPDRVMDYRQILQQLEEALRDESHMVLLGESYAWPQRVVAVVLSASFIRSPAPQFLRWLVGRWLFWIRPPRFFVRWLVVGKAASDELVDEVREAIAAVAPRVMSRRLVDVFAVDCSEALRSCKAPILYLAASEDRLVGNSAVRAIQSVQPDVKIARLNAPHLLLQTCPKEAWEEIQRLLQHGGAAPDNLV